MRKTLKNKGTERWILFIWGRFGEMAEESIDEDKEKDEDLEGEAETSVGSPRKKRIMILFLPLLIVIAISVGIYFAFRGSRSVVDSSYGVVQYDKENKGDVAVFYDLPEVKVAVASKERPMSLRLKINLELSSIEDLKVVEVLTPKLSDVVLSHIVELSAEELKGSAGMYWLKEELFYRLNLAAEPVKIKKISFGVFELQ